MNQLRYRDHRPSKLPWQARVISLLSRSARDAVVRVIILTTANMGGTINLAGGRGACWVG